MKFSDVFAILVGMGMVAQWAVSYFGRADP